MLSFVDTHCHINSKQYDDDLPKVITSCKKAGIKKMIVPGFDMFTSAKAVLISQQYPGLCFATIGIHPYHANKFTDLYDVKLEMKKMLNKYQITAIGEVGLDYHLYKNEDATGKKTQQQELLKLEIELALEHSLPLILHCRDAWDDYIDILSSYSKSDLRGVSHCFEGGKVYLKKVLDLGLYIGFNGMITFNDRLPDLAKETPLDRILLETDSPFLTPVPYRGQRNSPKNVRLVAKEIAHLKNTSLEAIASETLANANALFRLN